jgi:hypothetical protein
MTSFDRLMASALASVGEVSRAMDRLQIALEGAERREARAQLEIHRLEIESRWQQERIHKLEVENRTLRDGLRITLTEAKYE